MIGDAGLGIGDVLHVGVVGGEDPREDLCLADGGEVAGLRVVAEEMEEGAVDDDQQDGGGDAERAHGNEHDKGGDEVAGGDGLERVVVGADSQDVERGEVALHEHTAEPEENDAAEDVSPESGGGLSVLAQSLREGIGDGGAAHEDEEGHDDVPEGEAAPEVLELFLDHVGHGPDLVRGPEDGADHGEQEHVQSAEDVEGEESSVVFHDGILSYEL